MSRFNIVEILKGKMSIGQSQKLRSSLIIVQFAIAIMLMVCTLVSWQQISYLRKMPLGYNRTEVYSIPVEGDINPTKVLELMKIAVQGQTNIASITGIYNNLGRGKDGSTRTSVVGFDYKNREIRTNWMGVSYDFVKTLGLELKAGRDFSTTFATDSNAVVINEQMAALLREKEVIGTLLNVEDSAPPMKVIGVVKDFNFQSLHQPIKPLTLTISKDFPIHYILTKVNTADMSGSVKLLEQAYKQIIPNSHFNGSFLDQNVERQYRREEKLGQIFISGAIIAIILSCMGLLAMVILIVSQKTKEIGIRKVLGASVRSIISMISIDFLKLVIVSSVIAFPLAWLAMNKWLENYAYRITISLWIFLLVAAITVAIAIITVCLHAIRAALANPVKSLRTE